ncbi:hypothetical protein NY08_3055 [Rhodococcus sp. B7740]|nr:hypothetical protein NY08_3055 [Rhodococcus sp. B7740]
MAVTFVLVSSKLADYNADRRYLLGEAGSAHWNFRYCDA